MKLNQGQSRVKTELNYPQPRTMDTSKQQSSRSSSQRPNFNIYASKSSPFSTFKDNSYNYKTPQVKENSSKLDHATEQGARYSEVRQKNSNPITEYKQRLNNQNVNLSRVNLKSLNNALPLNL